MCFSVSHWQVKSCLLLVTYVISKGECFTLKFGLFAHLFITSLRRANIMFTSKRIGEVSVTPKNDNGAALLAFMAGKFADAAILAACKQSGDDFTIAEVDYCQVLGDVRSDDIRAAFERIRAGMGAGLTTDWQSVLDEAAEVTAAIDAACTAERKKFGVSSRYEFSATTGKWMRKESTPRAPKAEVVTVGEAAQPAKKVVHVATKGAIRFESGSTNELYSKVLHAVKGGEYKFTATKWNTVGKKLLKASGWQYSTELK